MQGLKTKDVTINTTAGNARRQQPDQSRTISTVLASTRAPWVTLTSFTVPARGDRTSFSIFIASTITTPCRAATTSPSFTSTLTMRPGIGATTLTGPLRASPVLINPRGSTPESRAGKAGDPDRHGPAVHVDGDFAACLIADHHLVTAPRPDSHWRRRNSLSGTDQQRPDVARSRDIECVCAPVHHRPVGATDTGDLDNTLSPVGLDLQRHPRRPSSRASRFHPPLPAAGRPDSGSARPLACSAAHARRGAAGCECVQRSGDGRNFLFVLARTLERLAAALLQELVQIRGVECRCLECRLLQHPSKKWDGGPNAPDVVLAECPFHSCNGLLAVGAPGRQLRNQRVVKNRDVRASFGAAVVANPRTARDAQRGNPAWRRHEAGVRILRINTALDRMTIGGQRRCGSTSSGSPRAMRICHCTRSTPVTISVIGCSTCRRVFISRK